MRSCFARQASRLVNLANLKRKRVNGKTLITRKGSDQRISGKVIKLSTD